MKKLLRTSLAAVFAGSIICAGTSVQAMKNQVTSIKGISDFMGDAIAREIGNREIGNKNDLYESVGFVYGQLHILYINNEFVGKQSSDFIKKLIKNVVNGNIFSFIRQALTNRFQDQVERISNTHENIFVITDKIQHDFTDLMDGEISSEEFIAQAPQVNAPQVNVEDFEDFPCGEDFDDQQTSDDDIFPNGVDTNGVDTNNVVENFSDEDSDEKLVDTQVDKQEEPSTVMVEPVAESVVESVFVEEDDNDDSFFDIEEHEDDVVTVQSSRVPTKEQLDRFIKFMLSPAQPKIRA